MFKFLFMDIRDLLNLKKPDAVTELREPKPRRKLLLYAKPFLESKLIEIPLFLENPLSDTVTIHKDDTYDYVQYRFYEDDLYIIENLLEGYEDHYYIWHNKKEGQQLPDEGVKLIIRKGATPPKSIQGLENVITLEPISMSAGDLEVTRNATILKVHHRRAL